MGSIPIARSINPDDSVDLTRLSYLNSTKKLLVLNGSWTVLDAIGRSLLDRTVEGPSEQLIADDVFRVRAFENKYEKPTFRPSRLDIASGLPTILPKGLIRDAR